VWECIEIRKESVLFVGFGRSEIGMRRERRRRRNAHGSGPQVSGCRDHC